MARTRRGDSVPVVQHLGILGHGKITSLRWQANAQAGRASLFSGDEQRTLGNMYFTTEQFRDAQEQEEAVWSKLRFIQGLQQWTPLDVHDFAIFLAEARYENWVILLTVHRAHQWAGRMHLTGANPGEVEGVGANTGSPQAQICQPLTAPLASSPDVSGADAFAAPDDVP